MSQFMRSLFRVPTAVKRDPAVDAWMRDHPGELGAIAARWFEVLRNSGPLVRELLHDGRPTACVGEAAFAYVNAFTAHVNIGFFHGADLPDPAGILQGTGKRMRHVKLRPGKEPDSDALNDVIEAAYDDIRRRLGLVWICNR